MASTKGTSSTKLPILTALTEDNKRWIVFGIALNHVLVPSIRPLLEQEILKEYNDLKLNHSIDVQTSHSFPRPKYPTRNGMKYENINANDLKLKPPHYKNYDYSTFDYKVTSHVDFGKLFLQNHMAKFNAFNETCDASAVLNLFGRIPVFSAILQTVANVVREGRNAWGHCKFTEWNEANFKKRFDDMKQLVTEVGLSPADESKVLADLNDWEVKGIVLCMNATIDSELVKVVQEHVNKLSSEVEKMALESQEEMNNLKVMLHNVKIELQECEKRFVRIENNMSISDDKIAQLTTNQEVLQQEVEHLQTSQTSVQQSVTEGRTSSYDFSSCEADIDYYAKRYDRDTRQWLLNDFDTWFCDSHESRAYVLLGDAAVGKSVMASVIAQRAKNDENMAAAFFCRHYDGTRRDPRYLLGSVAYQLRNCNSQYDKVVGGEAGIQSMLANAKLGVHELFTKLLEEPLSKCSPCKRKLVVIDALDEAEYWSREDFLDLIMNRFPLLPNWLVFFITSRPEDTVQSRLRTYNPCIRICAGNSGSAGFYQQHEQDIRRFLEKRVNFSILSYSAEEITDKCNGMFLYAFYIAEILQNPAQLDGDIFPENINDYFCKNFKRVYVKVGAYFYKKLFGCALVAPSPLPVSFISFLLQRENSSLDEQEVIDAVSQFVALRTTDKTFGFLHSLIPAWLTDEQKASRRLFVDRNKAKAYFKSIIVEFLNAFLQQGREPILFAKPDLVNYILSVGFRFFCKCCVRDPGSSQTLFDCLTNYRFLQERIRSNRIGIYFLIEDLEFSVLDLTFDEAEKTILDDVCSVLKRDKYVIVGCPELLHSCLSNASKLAQEKIMPNKVSASWMELCFKCPFFPTNSTLRDLDCGAFSHDRRLFARGKGRCIFLYDARTFERVYIFTKPVNVTFTSPDTIMLVCADGLYILWKIAHDDLLSPFDSDILVQNSSQKIRVKKCIFSHDGKLTATHQHCEILLFNGGKFISSVFKVVKECEHTVPCLAFSPDDSLLLFCIQKTNGDQSFYVFEVEIKLLSKAIVFPYTVHVDCCCFSLDNTRIFFCNASSVLILDYPPKYRSYESHAVPKSHYTASHTCSYCTLSSDNKLLACSISNEILIHPVNDPDTFWKVPQNHSGRIEFCKFLKGNCYLISYGIDGPVFLFDLADWKSVAYVRCENIISMVVSPNEDKVVCLQSSGEVSIINLYGLKCRLSSNFQLPSNFRLQERSFKPQAMQIAAPPPVDTEFEQDDFVDFISYSEYSNSSEEDVSDENFSSDLSATHSDCRS